MYSKTQQEVIDRYLEATKDCAEDRIPIAQIISLKRNIGKARPERGFLLSKIYSPNKDTKSGAGRPKKIVNNVLVQSVLSSYTNLHSAVRQYYWLSDIIAGVSRLDLGGNTRNLSTKTIYLYLSCCKAITVDLLKEAEGIGDRQAQKLLLAISISSRMVHKELVRMGYVVKCSAKADLDEDYDCHVQEYYTDTY